MFSCPTVCVIRMCLYGTWCQRILRGDTAAGTLTGRERLGARQPVWEDFSLRSEPVALIGCLRKLIWDGVNAHQSPHRYMPLKPKNPRSKHQT